MNAVQQVILPAHPMISSSAKRILSFTTINVAKGSIDYMAYFVRKGQKEVVEEDGCGRN